MRQSVLSISTGSSFTLSVDDMNQQVNIAPSANIDVTLPTAVEGMSIRVIHNGTANTISLKDGATTVASLTTGKETLVQTRLNSSGVAIWPTASVVISSSGVLDSGNVPSELPSALDGGVKGDILVFDGTDWQSLPVGADGTVLTADSAEPLGVKWV